MDTVVDLQGATLTRSGRRIVDSVTWTTRPGQHWVVMGPNGAGKTSVLRVATGREIPEEGDVSFLGVPIDAYAPTELSTAIGFSSHTLLSRVRPGTTVLNVVRTAAWGQAVSFTEEYEDVDTDRAHDLLSAFGIEHLSEHYFSTLSEGERQRVALARSLMTDPQLLVLDEPTAGLDLGARELLLSALTEIAEGPHAPQMILVTHQIEEIPAGFTHAAVMRDGQMMAQGPIRDILTGLTLSQVFDLPLSVEERFGRWRAHTPQS